MQSSFTSFGSKIFRLTNWDIIPIDPGRKLNEHKTFRRRLMHIERSKKPRSQAFLKVMKMKAESLYTIQQ